MENQTIVLNEKTIAVLKELRANATVAQQTINTVNSRMTDILTGICLTEGVDLNTQQALLAEDFSILTITNVPTKEDNSKMEPAVSTPRNTIKAKRRKL